MESKYGNTRGPGRITSGNFNFPEPAERELSSPWLHGESPQSSVSAGTDHSTVIIRRVSGLPTLSDSHSSPAAALDTPTGNSTTHRTRRLNTAPISKDPKVSRQSRIPVPLATWPSQESTTRPQKGQSLPNATSTLSSTSSHPRHQFFEIGAVSWDGSTLEAEAPKEWVSPPLAPYDGKGKSRADMKPPNKIRKRPALTAETFVPPDTGSAGPMFVHHNQTNLFGVAMMNGQWDKQPNLATGLNTVVEERGTYPPEHEFQNPDRTSPSPVLTASPIPVSRGLTPISPSVSPPITSSPIPPSPVSTPFALAFYTYPPSQMLKHSAAYEVDHHHHHQAQITPIIRPATHRHDSLSTRSPRFHELMEDDGPVLYALRRCPARQTLPPQSQIPPLNDLTLPRPSIPTTRHGTPELGPKRAQLLQSQQTDSTDRKVSTVRRSIRKGYSACTRWVRTWQDKPREEEVVEGGMEKEKWVKNIVRQGREACRGLCGLRTPVIIGVKPR